MLFPKALLTPMTAVAATVGLALLVLAGLAVAANPKPASVIASDAASPCEGADARVQDATTKELRKAVLCLMNRARHERGVGKLARDRALQKAAQRHVKAMIATNCLDDQCPDEPSLEDRLLHAGYFEGAKKWEYAENTGCASSAKAMVDKWLDSTFHRLNILKRKFEDVGIGIAAESPSTPCLAGYGTFAADFGWRKP
jgi:uncharacterized protein YkwD